MTDTIRAGTSAEQLPVAALIRLAETAQAVPYLIREGIIDRAAAAALVVIAADQAASPDGCCACGQGEIARRSGTSQPYLASVCLPQLVDAGLVARCRDGRRTVYTVSWDAARAAATDGGRQ